MKKQILIILTSMYSILIMNAQNASYPSILKTDYELMDLNELENYVKTNYHLPDIAPEKEMLENGVNPNDFQMKLLQKIEEITLYVIEQNKKLESLENEIKELKK